MCLISLPGAERIAVLLLAVSAPAVYGAVSAACASCHRAIFESYRKTPMARSSGATGRDVFKESFARASFTHAASGFRYAVSPYFLDFDKSTALRGRKQLAWFIGSGAMARSYVISADGFLFEAPVAYYSRERKWDLAPGYDAYAYPYLTRPIAPGCLGCHASFLNVVAGTQNRFAEPPFGEAGIACERCHGPGETHIARADGSAIVNPAKLAPGRRASVCAQCHLSGEVRVMRPGATWQSYRPGDLLRNSTTVFIRAGNVPGMTVTSHVENLAQSACQRGSGDRLWCGTCHDPHAVPGASQRAAWFRTKCLTCHARRGCNQSGAARAREGNDCTACHMPKAIVADAQHVVYTDHSIPRRPRRRDATPSGSDELVPFAGGPASPRDTALAYAIAAGRRPADQARARALLEAASRESPGDAEVLVYLAEMYRNAGEAARAIPLYRRVIQLDPANVTAPVGLGGILFERGEYGEAIRLWEDALAKNSGLVLAATNLAMAQWRTGDKRASEATLRKVLALSPGFQPAADLLEKPRR